MKRDIIITLLFCIADAFLIFLPWIPRASELIPVNPTVKESMDATIAILGMHGAVILTYLGTMLALHGSDRVQEHGAISAGLKRGEVRTLRDDDFYSEFLQHAKAAASYVFISYFAPYPPDTIQSATRRAYYDDILRAIRRKESVRFRRLVRDTPDNKAWIGTLISDFRGKPNADLGLVSDLSMGEMPLALSVQVIDGKYSWLVATRSHERVAEFRDVFIDDKIIAEEFRAYHERLWSVCTKLVESGRVSVSGESFLGEDNDAEKSDK